jgi:hypothetical protein
MKAINKGKSKKKKITATYLEKEAKRLFDEQFDEDTVPVDVAEIVTFLVDLTTYIKNKEKDDE